MTNNSTGPDDDAGALALRAAQAGATAIAAVVASGGVRTDFKSGGHDLVTTADKAAEAAVIEVIRAARPDDAILGEEGGAHPGTSGSRWLVDPLDGTANFVYGRADHAVSVGLETDGVITAGAIIRVSDGRWAAAAGGTASAGNHAGRHHRRKTVPAQREPAGPRRRGAGLLRPALRPDRPAAGLRHRRGAHPADQRSADRGFRGLRFPRPGVWGMRRLRRLRAGRMGHRGRAGHRRGEWRRHRARFPALGSTF